MINYIDDKTKKELIPILKNLEKNVRLIYFTQEYACRSCKEQLHLLEELASLSDKIKLETYDLVLNGDKALKYNINKIPATVVIGEKDYGIRFYGVTAGYEFSSLLQTILMISTGNSGLDPHLEKLIKIITKPIHLEVMVTLTCPYCFSMVHTSHQFAFINNFIKADMVDSGEFTALARKYDVSTVPKTIINGIHSFEGALPKEAVYLELLKAVMPQEYEKIEKALIDTQKPPHITQGKEEHIYDVIIVGGGPAAMSAAIYSSRKDMDSLIITKKFGGQITYTAEIENYIGMMGITGKEMAKIFRKHMEEFPMAESLGFDVINIKKEKDIFIVTQEDGKQFKGYAIIFCTGKEYKKLDIPGEEKFIGKGIAFCATCDAPLYKEKTVAVVGGGNSAFTAVRDLMGFASKIYLIHRRDQFTAEKALIEPVINSQKVKIYKNTLVREVLGKEKLTGIRLISKDGKKHFDLSIDGMFLEIGLIPNSNPVKEIIPLNKKNEVPIDSKGATPIPGFFAAGDVTDTLEKQISIAIGDGAKAALTSHKYLIKHGLTRSRIKTKETWQ